LLFGDAQAREALRWLVDRRDDFDPNGFGDAIAVIAGGKFLRKGRARIPRGEIGRDFDGVVDVARHFEAPVSNLEDSAFEPAVDNGARESRDRIRGLWIEVKGVFEEIGKSVAVNVRLFAAD